MLFEHIILTLSLQMIISQIICISNDLLVCMDSQNDSDERREGVRRRGVGAAP